MNKTYKQSEDLYKEKVEQLKAIYPALFSDEGNLNEDELRNFLKQFASTSEGKYEFNWAGKMTAKRNAFTTSRAMLKPDKDRSIDFDKTENLIIEGDNLEVLKLLQKSYQGKIKCIYIDPPYNTGNDFIYTDNFSEEKKAYWEKSGTTQDGVKLDTNTESQGRYHSNWLNMIYPRLLLARNLLREDGVIFISINDFEVHNLKKAMDEIFGEENFIAQLVWENKEGGGSSDSKLFRIKHEYLLSYTNNKNIVNIKGEIKGEDNSYTYEDEYLSKRGKYKLIKLNSFSVQYSPSLDYEILLPNGEKVMPSENGKRGCWRWSKEKLDWGIRNGFIEFKENSEGKLWVYTKQYSKVDNEDKPIIRELPFRGVISKYSSTKATKQLEQLMGLKLFDYSKPFELIKFICTISSDKDSIVLDFFAGSGTTAQAVMELNKEDRGNRKFILVQIPEKTDENSEAYKAGYKKISDICIERVKRVSKKLSEEKATGDLGFKVFTLSPSYFPENLFTPDPEKTEEENKKALAKYIEEASTQLEFKFDEFDLMYEVLLKDGFTLNFKAGKLSEFPKNNIYKVTDGEKHALVTLDPDLKDETLQKLQSYTEERFICLERAVDTTKKWNLQNMFGSNLWVI
ncbi:MAG TPA: site-specific DNA-methyltransferase [Candidatus Dojkabacteria bacterium]|nr:site-specific DNA-methyltransferase [Candidatus Dojkabacteria bacterium]